MQRLNPCVLQLAPVKSHQSHRHTLDSLSLSFLSHISLLLISLPLALAIVCSALNHDRGEERLQRSAARRLGHTAPRPTARTIPREWQAVLARNAVLERSSARHLCCERSIDGTDRPLERLRASVWLVHCKHLIQHVHRDVCEKLLARRTDPGHSLVEAVRRRSHAQGGGQVGMGGRVGGGHKVGWHATLRHVPDRRWSPDSVLLSHHLRRGRTGVRPRRVRHDALRWP
jgi:hypothetical protein